MAANRVCPDCGNTLGDDAPLGVCPRCVLRLGMAAGEQPTNVDQVARRAGTIVRIGQWGAVSTARHARSAVGGSKRVAAPQEKGLTSIRRESLRAPAS